MPQFTPMPTLVVGDVFTTTRWGYLRDNLNKLLNTGHRVLTVAQFGALSSPEGTKGTVAPDEVYLEVDSTNGILWHLAYESGEPTYKWRFIGGPPMSAEVAAQESTTSAAYAALATAGPAIALSRAGDYDVMITHRVNGTVVADMRMSYDIGGTGAVDADSAYVSAATGQFLAGWRKRRKVAIAASTTLTAKYKTSAGTALFGDRYMEVTPARLV